MTVTPSPALFTLSGVPATSASTISGSQHEDSAITAGPEPITLITQVAAELVRSADPEAVFGSLATAYARHTQTHCTVELLIGTTIRLVQAHPEAGEQACDETTAQPSLSPTARQLLAGDGSPSAGADWFALPIGAATCPATGAEIPVGAFICRFPDRRTHHGHLAPARYLIGLATEVLQAEGRLTKAHSQVANLEIALSSNRDIGTAIGILMNAHLITQDEAFGMLRVASQHSHRKLREVANDVIFTGALAPVPPTRRP
jgi:hypothetical protein